ncbi:Os02g0736700 [Oryza sativa Japonica Group]|uniref:Os02g0736700 protein n=1 Tax=Oryza sativa subsp. japonica TaxID=39947 RepID=Q0DXR8_ORYSJ|nr:Os02g0736700 [Oryza sativa Japonica Group]|eukprot:NP_001048056.1 Os02g0736700 [Oryza sativa Japonica Group]
MLGGGGVGGGKKPPPPGVHPRYVPKRGSVLKGIVRRMLGLFVFLLPQQGGGGAANGSGGGGRVRPAAPPVDDGGEQGKSAEDFYRNTQFFIFRCCEQTNNRTLCLNKGKWGNFCHHNYH